MAKPPKLTTTPKQYLHLMNWVVEGMARRRLRKDKVLTRELKKLIVIQLAAQRLFRSDYEIDHIIPVAGGGSDDPTNLCAATKEFNRKIKRDKRWPPQIERWWRYETEEE